MAVQTNQFFVPDFDTLTCFARDIPGGLWFLSELSDGERESLPLYGHVGIIGYPFDMTETFFPLPWP